MLGVSRGMAPRTKVTFTKPPDLWVAMLTSVWVTLNGKGKKCILDDIDAGPAIGPSQAPVGSTSHTSERANKLYTKVGEPV